MVVLLSLALMALGWALGCCLIYALLRWFDVQVSFLARTFSEFVLVIWVILLMGLTTSALNPPAPFTFVPSPKPSPWILIMSIWLTMFCGFTVGGVLWMRNTNKRESWWHNTLLCALYLGLAHVLGYTLLISWPLPGVSAWQLKDLNTIGTPSLLLLGLAWFFPLGPPMLEVAFNSFKRAHDTNKTGSLI